MTSGAEWKIKGLVFMGIVVGAAVSGAEAHVVGPHHAKRIDAAVVKKLQCMMSGAARYYDEDADKHESLPSIDVWRRWRLTSYAIETCVRRLKWWQDIVANPDRNTHLLSIFFGTLPHETQDQNTLDERGVITPNVHPWARQLGDDFEEMLKAVDDAQWLNTT